jgi:hypothetical protein
VIRELVAVAIRAGFDPLDFLLLPSESPPHVVLIGRGNIELLALRDGKHPAVGHDALHDGFHLLFNRLVADDIARRASTSPAANLERAGLMKAKEGRDLAEERRVVRVKWSCINRAQVVERHPVHRFRSLAH